MSRIGKTPVKIPKGVQVSFKDGKCTVKGPLGTLSLDMPETFKIEMEDGSLKVIRPDDSRKNRALHGLYRNLIRNMVVGVSEGYRKELEIVGVGYKVAKKGKSIQINIGYSHPVEVKEDEGIEFEVPNQTTIVVKGIDKQKVGQVAANIRRIRPPEPYKGKGIRYKGEFIRRKVGKSGA